MVKRTHMFMLGMVGSILLLSVVLGEAQDARKVYFGVPVQVVKT